MGQPRYQEVNSSTIPVIEKDGVTMRLVAGELDGIQRSRDRDRRLASLHGREAGSWFEIHLPHPKRTHRCWPMSLKAQENLADEVVESVSMVVFNDDGDQIEVKSDAAGRGVQFMLIAGAPFKEPIVPYGPFVMNTVEEIQQTIAELRNGTFIQQ